MTTTEQFRKHPDYSTNQEDCLKREKDNTITNPRYKGFDQVHFTAGDEGQFQMYRDQIGCVCNSPINIEENKYKDLVTELQPSIKWEKYKNLNTDSVSNTFNYLFYKFKKGIFIKIKNNQVKVFLPFSNENYVNEWSHLVEFDEKFLKETSARSGFRSININQNVNRWYANNCLIRNEYPLREGDTGNDVVSDMFQVLCRERKIPDIEFFLNRRDFPLIKKNETEPYEALFGENQKLLSHNYPTYSPILSMVSKNTFADIACPTIDDWARIASEEKKFFLKLCTRSFSMESKTPWKDKIPKGIFRGTTTGCGVTEETNPRIKVSVLSKRYPDFIDAGITKWNLRPRKVPGNKKLQTFSKELVETIGKVDPLTPDQQAEYKYIIHVDGHVSAYRLSLELGSGSCVLIVDSDYIMWYKKMLRPYTHYVPVKKDCSDLVSQIEWCRKNDEKCKEIADNSKKFVLDYLQKDGILDYLQSLLVKLKEQNGDYIYNFITFDEAQKNKEREIINLEWGKELQIKNLTLFHKIQDEKFELFSTENKKYLENLFLQYLFKSTKNSFLNPRKWGFMGTTKSKISEFSIDNTTVKIVEKDSKSCVVHETFIGLYGVNPITRYVPNFCYTYGMDENKIYLEYVDSKFTLLNYIENKDSFSMEIFIQILIQVSLALHVAQESCCFIHNDLGPQNILLVKNSRFLYYPVQDKYIEIICPYIPVLIDFEYSNIIYKGKNYGKMNPLQLNSGQDILTLVYRSIRKICKVMRLNENQTKVILKIINFFTEGVYTLKNIFNIKNYLEYAGSYSYLFSKNKKEAPVTPLSFFNLLTSIQKTDILSPMKKDFSLLSDYDILYFQNCLTVPKDRLVLNNLQEILSCSMKFDNKFLAYYWGQNVFNFYLKHFKPDSRSLEKLQDKIEKVISETPLKEFEKIKIVETDFLGYPESVLQNFQKLEKIISAPYENGDFCIDEYKKMIISVFADNGTFRLPQNIEKFYKENLNYILDCSVFKNKKAFYQLESLKEISKDIYKVNLKSILKEKCTDCSIYEKYIQVAKKIIS